MKELSDEHLAVNIKLMTEGLTNLKLQLIDMESKRQMNLAFPVKNEKDGVLKDNLESRFSKAIPEFKVAEQAVAALLGMLKVEQIMRSGIPTGNNVNTPPEGN